MKVKGIRNWHSVARNWKQFGRIILKDDVANRIQCLRSRKRRRKIKFTQAKVIQEEHITGDIGGSKDDEDEDSQFANYIFFG